MIVFEKKGWVVLENEMPIGVGFLVLDSWRITQFPLIISCLPYMLKNFCLVFFTSH
jgi:hypothetical protein